MKQKELTLILCVIWALSILYGEMFAFWLPSLYTCSWPHLSPSHSTMHGAGESSDYVKVAVITDPQLMDRTSLNLPPKSLALEIAQFYTDLFMRRAYSASILPFKPNVISFLGDYFDGGPYLSDEEWQESLSRFKHIFHLNTQGRDKDLKVYWLPGNHDIGYAALHSYRPQVIKRYENEFGVRNSQFIVGKVEFIAIDAQTLDGNPQNKLTSQTWEFIKNVSQDVQLYPRVLLTHIPLYRNDSTYCGPDRYSPIINQRISRSSRDQEIMYQNYVTEKSSTDLLDLIKPVLVLSGHDHDQCTVIHKSNIGSMSEQTLGTVSWQQGNLYPSFMLLSARNFAHPNSSNPEEAVITRLCFLPWQTYIYIWYVSLFVLTLLALLLWPTSGLSLGHWFGKLMENARELMKSGTKEKNEDLDCEYEMIWDADGTMHLVKKASSTPITHSRETNLVERGNAVMRPTARKTVSSEMEVSVDMTADSDQMAKLPSRTGKSRTKFVIQRLLRTFRLISVIAAVNIPLYMMLLFKDWVE